VTEGVSNNIQGSTIYGDYVAGDKNVYTIQEYKSLFSTPIFLHYLGKKVSALIGCNNNMRSLIGTTKIIILLFDDIFVSLSDVTQSSIIYNSSFFRRLLGYKVNGTYLLSITGTKSDQDLDMFLSERQEFYEKPGFYKIVSKKAITSFLDNIKESSMTKRFDTGKILGQKWSENFGQLERTDFAINDIHQNSLKNLILANREYFYSKKLDEIILIPERLRGYPFVWDSVQYLNLISTDFDPVSLENIEIYLASEWINCYLANYGAVIPNSLIGVKNCTLGIECQVNFSLIIQFLSNYGLLSPILSLTFDELIELKQSLAIYLRQMIDDSANNKFIVSSPLKVERKLKKIFTSSMSDGCKIRKAINCLYEERQ